MNIINVLMHTLQGRPTGHRYRHLWQILHLDLLLLTNLALLIVIGFFVLYSASNGHKAVVTNQAWHVGIAMVVMIIIAQIPPQLLKRWTPYFYIISLLLLLIVLITGHIAKGAQRWLNLGILHFQPSELMKLAIPMMLAWYYCQKTRSPTLRDLVISAVIILLPALLVAKQPDLGTSIVLVVSGSVVILFAGIYWRIIIGSLSLLLIAAPLVWHFLKNYQKQRILTFLSPERDPLGAGYHIIQSKIAIGSGGLLGKGWLHGTQSHLHFLPEHTTDFIFALSSEEFGLIGCLILLLLYITTALRGFYIALQTQDTFSRLLAACLSLTFFLSAFINMAMVSGILPVVGLPLPLISYSGTSMVTLLASFGMLMAISGYRKLFEN